MEDDSSLISGNGKAVLLVLLLCFARLWGGGRGAAASEQAWNFLGWEPPGQGAQPSKGLQGGAWPCCARVLSPRAVPLQWTHSWEKVWVFKRAWGKLYGYDPFVLKMNKATKQPGTWLLGCFVAYMRRLVHGDATDCLGLGGFSSPNPLQPSPWRCSACWLPTSFPQYLNNYPTADKKDNPLELLKRWGSPGHFGSWDCKHYFWRSCPMTLSGKHRGKKNWKFLVMEAIADTFLYTCHLNFGELGLLNNIKVLDRSSIMGALLTSSFDNKVPSYSINNRRRNRM